MNAMHPRPGQALAEGTPVIVRQQLPEAHCRTPFYWHGVKGITPVSSKTAILLRLQE